MKRPLLALLLTVGLAIGCEDIPAEKPSCFGNPYACGVHATCDLGTGSCLCDPGYVGPACAACAVGFQDRNANGSCAPTCGSEVCGAHSRCADESGLAACECVVGYSRAEGNGCFVFSGGPRDPAFRGTRPNAWTVTGKATIERSAARFEGAGAVSQSVDMPAYADAEPLSLQVVTQCAAQGNCGNVGGTLAIAFDDVETTRIVDFAHSEPLDSLPLEICLGERAFGHTLRLALRTSPPADGLGKGADQDMLITRAQFAPSSSCPTPGNVLDGDFGDAEGGRPWGVISDPASVGLITILSHNGFGAQLHPLCNPPGSVSSMSTAVSIPMVLDSAALVFSINGTSGSHTNILLDDKLLRTVEGKDMDEKIVLCLPSWSHGLAPELKVEVPSDPACELGNVVVVVDNFVLTSDSSCAGSP